LGAQLALNGGLRSLLRAAMVLVVALGISACSTRGGNVPYAPADFGPPDKVMPSDVAYDLPLGPLDMLRVHVFRVPELSGDYQVDAKGMLDLPLIGTLNVREYTPQQLGAELESRYSQRYLNNPEITVRVTNSNNNSVTVEGGVNGPGIYPIPGRITLVGAIALARGVSVQDGNPRRVVVFRKSGGKTLAAAFDLISIRRGEMEDPAIFPGDTVVVDSSTTRPLYRDLMMSLPLFTIFTQL
jgi:polysaccharide export outer membrane protein